MLRKEEKIYCRTIKKFKFNNFTYDVGTIHPYFGTGIYHDPLPNWVMVSHGIGTGDWKKMTDEKFNKFFVFTTKLKEQRKEKLNKIYSLMLQKKDGYKSRLTPYKNN